ncbi:hypothetical protein PRZ48_009033 [Zasmidium cellare]|uniref:Uncharacterized protein n=1 Tax=Zasmidium cellare TaxID=395010 RepID=A0ABR0EHX5_ZASCE|nr:hypothetical protein PRZ48_009033 [Zasmidium cellare]
MSSNSIRKPTEPSVWVPKKCIYCKRNWRDLIDEYGSEEQQRWAYKSRQNNLDQAVRDIYLEHPCNEREAWETAAEERANKRAAEELAQEEEDAKKDEEARKDGKRRSGRVRKNNKGKMEETNEE